MASTKGLLDDAGERDDALCRLIVGTGLFEESEETHELVDRLINSPSFPECQTPEAADRMLAEVKRRIHAQQPHRRTS
jgi:hypothetical protein